MVLAWYTSSYEVSKTGLMVVFVFMFFFSGVFARKSDICWSRGPPFSMHPFESFVFRHLI